MCSDGPDAAPPLPLFAATYTDVLLGPQQLSKAGPESKGQEGLGSRTAPTAGGMGDEEGLEGAVKVRCMLLSTS